MSSRAQFSYRLGVVFCQIIMTFIIGSALAKSSFAKGQTSKVLPSFIELAPNEQLAHPIVKGQVGPWLEAYVVLTRPKDEYDETAPFKGRVVVPNVVAGAPAVYKLPLLAEDQVSRRFDVLPLAIMFRAIDRSSTKVLLLLYEGYRTGSGEKPYRMCTACRWNGNEFVEDELTQQQLAGPRNAKEIDRRLAKIKAQGK